MKLQNITLSYGNRTVLENITTEFSKGEFVFLIGASGSGKTSLIRTLTGAMAPKNGTIELSDGRNLYGISESELAKYRRSIGTIFQDYKLLPSKTVRENVAFAMEVCGYPDSKIRMRVPEVLSEVGILSKKDAMIDTLSGGEAQRVAIARALIHNPDIIIADEPTGNLDPENALEIMRLLENLAKEGKTIIVATHDEKLVNHLKKRVIALKNGSIVSDEKNGTYAFPTRP